MANETFKAGDVVVITVGIPTAPRMTIVWVENGEASCIWYSSTNQIFHSQKFPVECLRKAG